MSADLASLEDLFTAQDRSVRFNRAQAQAAFGLIERGLVLGWQIATHINTGDVLADRKAKNAAEATPETIRANLLHSAWSGLVSATRLTLYGAFVDALALTRSAFEAAYHAEFFRDRPADAIEWDGCGQITNLADRRKCIDDFTRSHGVRNHVDQKYAGSVDPFFFELATFGTHANPVTVGLRMSSHLQGVSNLGFASAGKAEAPKLCAHHVLHTLGYVLSEYNDGFGSYLGRNPSLFQSYSSFVQDLNTWRQQAPGDLSLLK